MLLIMSINLVTNNNKSPCVWMLLYLKFKIIQLHNDTSSLVFKLIFIIITHSFIKKELVYMIKIKMKKN